MALQLELGVHSGATSELFGPQVRGSWGARSAVPIRVAQQMSVIQPPGALF